MRDVQRHKFDLFARPPRLQRLGPSFLFLLPPDSACRSPFMDPSKREMNRTSVEFQLSSTSFIWGAQSPSSLGRLVSSDSQQLVELSSHVESRLPVLPDDDGLTFMLDRPERKPLDLGEDGRMLPVALEHVGMQKQSLAWRVAARLSPGVGQPKDELAR
eukprot:765113-Hanusia_phi.AAC.2